MQENHFTRALSVRHWCALLPRLLAFGLTLCMLVLTTPATPLAHADGGAPNLAYVAGGAQGLSVVDIGQQKVVKTVALTGDPAAVYLTLDGRYVYVAQPASNQVTMLAASSGATVCSASIPGQPSLLAYDPGINVLYVAGNGAAGITALEGNSCTIKRTITTSGPVYGMAIAQVGSGISGGNGNQLWFTTSEALHVYQQDSGQTQNIAIPGGPQYVSVPQGATVYVTTRAGTVVSVSLQTLQPTPALITGGDFGPMDYDAFTGEVYVPDRKHNQVEVLTPIYFGSTNLPKEPNHVIPVEAAPQSVAITSDGNLGFVALAGGKVVMLDIPGKTLISTLAVGGNPRFIITGLYPPSATQKQQTNNGIPLPTTLLYIMAAVALLLLGVIALLMMLARRQRR